MQRLKIHPEAEWEIEYSAVYYSKQAEGLERVFLSRVDQALDLIRRFPRIGGNLEGEYRRCLLRKFPFGIIYRIEGETSFIIAVAHLHRKPGYWRDREQSWQ